MYGTTSKKRTSTLSLVSLSDIFKTTACRPDDPFSVITGVILDKVRGGENKIPRARKVKYLKECLGTSLSSASETNFCESFSLQSRSTAIDGNCGECFRERQPHFRAKQRFTERSRGDFGYVVSFPRRDVFIKEWTHEWNLIRDRRRTYIYVALSV